LDDQGPPLSHHGGMGKVRLEIGRNGVFALTP
jgi:hypothetical protein